MTTTRRRTIVLVAAGLFLVVLGLSWWGKEVCLDGERGFWAITRYCYSDVHILWSFRGFDVDAVPYAGAPVGYVENYVFEYPTGLGFGAWVLALLTDSRRGFFNLNAFTLAICAIVAFVACARVLRRADRSPWWLLGMALSPALLLFGFQNWDLWAVAPAVLGVSWAQRGRPVGAAVWFAIGTAMKWWPGLLLLLVAFGVWAPGAVDNPDPGTKARWWASRRWRPVVVWLGVTALLQAPALVISVRGWVDAHLFHLRRTTNIESGLQGLHDLGGHLWPGSFWDNGFWRLLSVGSLLVLVGLLVVIGRRLHQRTIDPLDAALAIVTLFLVTSRVASPQFLLWLIPFAVIARANWLPILAAEMLNAINWLLYGPVLAGGDQGFTRASQAVGLLRWFVLLWVLYDTLRRRALPAPSSESPSMVSPAPVAGSGEEGALGAGSSLGAGAGVG